MEQCIFDLGLMNYNPAVTWIVPISFFFLALVDLLPVDLHAVMLVMRLLGCEFNC